MITYLILLVQGFWDILREAAPFLLFGYTLAGVLHLYVRTDQTKKLFSEGGIKSVLLAAVIGAPLPLCSCGVLPTAMGLRKKGASKSATTAFLISTPETGVDSISITYALIDGTMAVLRPIAAICTAVVSGIMVEWFADEKDETKEENDDSDCVSCSASETDEEPEKAPSFREAIRFAFVDLFDDIVCWLVIGLFLAAALTAFVPKDSIAGLVGNSPLTYFLILLISLPLYVCATSSTPIAAALLMIGISPGAVLVFLLAGPATNITSLTVLGRFFGKKTTAIYLLSIILVSVCFGLAVDLWAVNQGYQPLPTQGTMGRSWVPSWISVPSAIVLAVLIISGFRRILPAWYKSKTRIWANRIENLTGYRPADRLFIRFPMILILVFYLCSNVYMVNPGCSGIVKRFGKILAPCSEPGIHIAYPYPIDKVEIVSRKKIRKIEIGFTSDLNLVYDRAAAQFMDQMQKSALSTRDAGTSSADLSVFNTGGGVSDWADNESLYLCGDENLARIYSTVTYVVDEPVKYRYGLVDPNLLVRNMYNSELRRVLSELTIDRLLTNARAEVEKAVKAKIQNKLDAYNAGIRILEARLRDVHTPAEVHPDFRDVASAKEDQERAINLAYVYKVETLTSAVGQAHKTIIEADGYRLDRMYKADGKASRFIDAAKAQKAYPVVTRERAYLETMEKSLRGVRKIITTESSPSGGIDLWLWDPAKTSAAGGLGN